MDYTEQFIRLNCSLMSDYKMMKLNADMGNDISQLTATN